MKYRLTEKIGTGGMAEVFRAVGEGPARFERPFVIKRIHPRLSEAADFVRMFVDEATISARLLHPNIVQVFEFAHHDGGYYCSCYDSCRYYHRSCYYNCSHYYDGGGHYPGGY